MKDLLEYKYHLFQRSYRADKGIITTTFIKKTSGRS